MKTCSALIASRGSELHFFSLPSAEHVFTYYNGTYISIAAISPDGEHIAIVERSSCLRIIQYSLQKRVYSIIYTNTQSAPIRSISWIDNDEIAIATENIVRILDWKKNKISSYLKKHEFVITHLSEINNDGLIATSDISNIKIWDIKSKKEIKNIELNYKIYTDKNTIHSINYY